MKINPFKILTLVLIVVALALAVCVKADEVSDYMRSNGIPEETEIDIIFNVHYKTYMLVISYGDTLYVRNLKRRPIKNVKKKPKFYQHPNVSLPKRGTGNSINITRGYN